MKRRLARAVVQPVVEQLEAWAATQQVKIMFGGSWRRGCATVGDLDLIVLADTLEGIVLPGDTVPYRDGSKVAQLAIDGVQVDVWACPPDQAGPFLWFVTGPKDLNITMRTLARQHGWKLSQYGLAGYDGPVATEADVAAALGMPCLTPEQRDDWAAHWQHGTGATVPIVGATGRRYLLERDEFGRLSCSCPGFLYRKHCKHTADPARWVA